MPITETHQRSEHDDTTILRAWATELEDNTRQQALAAARLPIMAGPVALMPDAHLGRGATVGSVLATDGAIIPAAVGVDIGCGMSAVQLNITDGQLPDSLGKILGAIRTAVPAGVGQGHDKIGRNADQWLATYTPPSELSDRQANAAYTQFGTLGSGNHFIEVCVAKDDSRVWIMLHSGSRGIGNQLAQGHIKTARNLANELHLRLEDPDLAYFLEGTPEFDAYMADLLWAQDYARANRDEMMTNVLAAVIPLLPEGTHQTERVNCHHNFSAREIHNGREMWITRKGAISARDGELGIIPGSMGTASFIVRGLGNPLSYESCSHGAGRRHSRGAAKRLFTTEDFVEKMQGKTWQDRDALALLDEHPDAYKPIEQVMADQADLVTPVHELRQIVSFKGTK